VGVVVVSDRAALIAIGVFTALFVAAMVSGLGFHQHGLALVLTALGSAVGVGVILAR
jgi:uncharacterized membrane protein